ERARHGALALGGRAADEQTAHVAAAEAERPNAESRPSERAIVHARATSGQGSYNDGHEHARKVRIRDRSARGNGTRAPRAATFAGGAGCAARSRDRAAVLRWPVEQQGSRGLHLPALRASALSLRDKVRVGDRLAVVL